MRSTSLFSWHGAAALLLCAGSTATLTAQAVIQAEPLIVAETPLVVDAAGTSQLRTPDAAPMSTRSFATLTETVANLHLNASGAGSYGALFSLRGLANTPYFSDPSVAVYFDDLPLGSSFSYPVDLFGFSSVTVSRGPQPAASGRGGEGGLIRFSSAAAEATAGGSLRVGLGNYEARQAALHYHTAGGGRASGSISASFGERDGYIENTTLHARVDDRQSASGAARFQFHPSATSEIALQLLVHQRRDGAQPLVPLGGPLFTVARGREGSTDSDFAGGAVKLAFDTAVGRLSAVTSRTRWSLAPYDNRLVLPPTLDSHLTQAQSAWNEELRLVADPTTTTPWQVGAWFSDTRTHGDVNRAIPGLFPIEASRFALRSRVAAAFGEVTLRAAAGWDFTAALRAEQTRRTFDRSQQIPAPGAFAASRTFRALLPKLTARYTLSANTHASLAVGAGTKPGGWSAYTDNPALAGFAAERVTAYEAGIDTALPQRALKLAARVFDYEIRDYQIERSFNATDYLVVNAPRARATGGEVETAWHPLAYWTFTATLGATDITLREFKDPFTAVSYAGRRAPYAPIYDAHLGVAYHTSRGWFAVADLTAIGRTYFDESEDAAFAAPAHLTGNAQLGYDTTHWRVSAHVENLADVRYTTLIIPGVGHQIPGAPRTYGVELTAKW